MNINNNNNNNKNNDKKLNAEQIREANINKVLQEGSKKNLAAAKQNKNDEFYTRYEDIEKELNHYSKKLNKKTILMNCDDPEWSNFWKYFKEQQQFLGIKKLISTHFEPDGSSSYALIREKSINHSTGKEGYIQKKIKLNGNGDFRSDECINFMKEADIVVTNPPFSLFREYIALLNEHNKKFIIIGNINAITYKETFKLIKEDKIYTGSGDRVNHFHKDINGIETTGASGCWFTNLGSPTDRPRIDLIGQYEGNEEKYPKYKNYDAINVNKTKDIPHDYFGVMGVPITFLHKLNSDQFEIVGCGTGELFTNFKLGLKLEKINKGKKTGIYCTESRVLMLPFYGDGRNQTIWRDQNKNEYTTPYARLLIKRKENK